MAYIKEWKVEVALHRTLTISVEEGEDEVELRKWLFGKHGRKYVQNQFVKGISCLGFPRNAEIEIVSVDLKETQPNKIDGGK